MRFGRRARTWLASATERVLLGAARLHVLDVSQRQNSVAAGLDDVRFGDAHDGHLVTGMGAKRMSAFGRQHCEDLFSQVVLKQQRLTCPLRFRLPLPFDCSNSLLSASRILKRISRFIAIPNYSGS